MRAIREIQDVKSGEIKISLPADFQAKRVEIIILQIDEPSETKQSLQDLLLSAPTLTDEELQQFNNVREWTSEWNVKDF